MNNIEHAVWRQHANYVVMRWYGYTNFLPIRAAIEARTKHNTPANGIRYTEVLGIVLLQSASTYDRASVMVRLITWYQLRTRDNRAQHTCKLSKFQLFQDITTFCALDFEFPRID